MKCIFDYVNLFVVQICTLALLLKLCLALVKEMYEKITIAVSGILGLLLVLFRKLNMKVIEKLHLEYSLLLDENMVSIGCHVTG